MKTFSHWVPAAFCGFLSVIALIPFVRSSDKGWWSPVFLCFLPMCFFLVGATTTQMRRELSDLRRRLAQLEDQRKS